MSEQKMARYVLIRFSKDEYERLEAAVLNVEDELIEAERWRDRYCNQEGLAIYELVEP